MAIKILKSIATGDPDTVRRFIREAKAASELIQLNISTVYAFGVTGGGEAYIVLEFLEGHRLSDLLAREGPLPLRRALHILGQICSLLGHEADRSSCALVRMGI